MFWRTIIYIHIIIWFLVFYDIPIIYINKIYIYILFNLFNCGRVSQNQITVNSLHKIRILYENLARILNIISMINYSLQQCQKAKYSVTNQNCHHDTYQMSCLTAKNRLSKLIKFSELLIRIQVSFH